MVTAVGVPPSAETIDSPDRNALEKMIRPSVFQTATAIVLAPLPAIAAIVLAVHALQVRASPKQGWEGFSQTLGVMVAAHVVLGGGTICATLAVVLGAAAMWRIHRRPPRTRLTAAITVAAPIRLATRSAVARVSAFSSG